MSTEHDAVVSAEEALAKAKATAHVGEAAPAEPVKPVGKTSSYLGHVGEPPVKGKDFE